MAQKKTKLLISQGFFRLYQVSTEKNRMRYLISVDQLDPRISNLRSSEIADLLDPHNNRGSRWGWTWRYRSRTQAEQLLTLAVLRWC